MLFLAKIHMLVYTKLALDSDNFKKVIHHPNKLKYPDQKKKER